MPLNDFGKFIRDYRIQHGMILYNMAQDLEVGSAFLSGCECGTRKIPEDWIEKLPKLYPSINKKLLQFLIKTENVKFMSKNKRNILKEGQIMLKSKPERHLDICNELNALYTKKNHDYGDSFHQTFLEEGFAMSRIRLADKFNRFKTLSRGTEALVGDESIRDTLIDLANYAVMTVLEMDDAVREQTAKEADSCATSASSYANQEIESC